MKREGMSRQDMESVKKESPTLVPAESEGPTIIPSMEDADTVSSTEVEAVAVDDGETVKSVETDGDTVNAREIPAMDANVVGTPENPVNLESVGPSNGGEVTGEIDMEADAVDMRKAENSVEALEKAMESSRSEAETVDRPHSAESEAETVNLPIKMDEFNNIIKRADELGFSELTGSSFDDYSRLSVRAQEVPDEMASKWFWQRGALKQELAGINATLKSFSGLVSKASMPIAKPPSGERSDNRVTLGTGESRGRTKKATRSASKSVF